MDLRIHDESNFKFEIGKGEVLQDGSDVAIIANGLLVNEAIEAGKALKAAGISARIINLCTIKPLDAKGTSPIAAAPAATAIMLPSAMPQLKWRLGKAFLKIPDLSGRHLRPDHQPGHH